MLCTLGGESAAHAKDFKLWGKDVSFIATTTLSYEYRGDNDDDSDLTTGENPRGPDDNLHYVFHTIDMALSHDAFRLGARFDMHLWVNTFFQSSACPGTNGCNETNQRFVDQYYFLRDDSGDPGPGGLSAFRPERIFFTINKPVFDMTIGDFYASFGRGIALNVVKLDELGQDTTIRGGKLVVHKGPFNLTVLAGTFNFLDVDQATGYLSKEFFPEEPVFAARMSYSFFDLVELGVHAVHVVHIEADDDTETVWGVSADLPNLLGGDLSFSAEVDFQRTVKLGCVIRGFGEDEGCSQRGFRPHLHGLRGMAAYATATLSRGDWTFNAEGRYFNDFELGIRPGQEGYGVAYSQPPTLERVYANPTDIPANAGGRFRVDYNFGELGPIELMVFANYTLMHTYGDGLYRVHDPYGGIELTWQDSRGHWNLLGGVRLETDRESGERHRLDAHLFGDIEQPIGSHHSVQFNYFLRKSEKVILGTVKWTEMDLAFQYKWSPYVSLAYTLEYSSEPSVVVVEPGTFFTGKFFHGGSLRYFINASSYINLRVGQNRPGLKCLNGLCRRFPGFAGVQLLAVGRI